MIRCQIYDKLRRVKKLSQEETKTLMNVVRNEINFLIRNGILLTPINYERWFYIFCYIYENKKELTDLEILGLYKDYYGTEEIDIPFPEEERPEGYAEKLKEVAEAIDRKLLEFVESLDFHQRSIDTHTTSIKEKKEEIGNSQVEILLSSILEELKDIKRENINLKEEIKEYHQEIQKLKEELTIAKTEANVDFLTGLINKRRFERTLSELLKDFNERKYPFSLIVLDIDNFKQINDSYGHPIGDLVLKEIATIFKNYLRANTITARIGGEEFAILLPGVEITDAIRIADRLRTLIENRTIRYEDHNIHITASFGVTEAKSGDTVNSIIERADKALYIAKRNGKNKVEVL